MTRGARDDRERERRSPTTTSRRTTRPRSRPSSPSSRTRRGRQFSFDCEIVHNALLVGPLGRWAICTETCSGMLGAVRTKQVCTGREADQDDEAEVKEARAGQKLSSASSASTRRRARLEGGAVQLDSEQAGARWLDDAQKLGHAAEKAAKGRQGSERSWTAPKSRATRRQVRRRGGLLVLREGGARHVNAEPLLVGNSLQ